jgi:hypothetical protein
MNKTQKVLEYMKNNPDKGITQLDAIQLCWATRLSAIIFNLKEKYVIETVQETGADKFGDTTRFSRYFYKGEKN